MGNVAKNRDFCGIDVLTKNFPMEGGLRLNLSKQETIDLLKSEKIGYTDKAPFIHDFAQVYPPILTVREVGEILGVSIPTARRIVAEAYETKVFPVAQTMKGKGGRYRIPTGPFLRYVFLGEIHPEGIREALRKKSKGEK